MPTPVNAGPATSGPYLSWTASKQSWIIPLTGTLLFLAAFLSWWCRSQWSLATQVALWAVLLVAVAVLSRRGWLKLFGPVLFYDLLRTGRRGRHILLRFIYALALSAVLYLDYSHLAAAGRIAPAVLQSQMTGFAEQFFNKFMLLQLFLVVVLTPIYVAGAIAEEKERRTLEYLLATDLRNREIVLSKLVSRLAHLTLLVLTGLPILSFVQFLGGVDPGMVLAAFAATGLTMTSLASLSILHSVYVKKPRNAILLTYLSVGAYIGLGYLLEQLAATPPRSSSFDGLVDTFNAGNLAVVLSKMRSAVAAGTPLATILTGLLRSYAIFHALVTVVCAGWAVAALRGVAIRQGAGALRKAPPGPRPRIRPRMGILPMVWKEVFIEPGFRLNWLGKAVLALLVVVSFVPAVLTVNSYFWHGPAKNWYQGRPYAWYEGNFLIATSRSMNLAYWANLGVELNPWVRITGTAVACLMLLGVAVRASTSISGERDRATFDALLTSPLDSHEILFAKWLGSLLSVRWAWVWLWLIWGVGLVTGAMHPIAIILCSVAWLVYASCLAAIGLWFSTTCRTTLRATLCTLCVTAGVGGGHWAASLCCLPFLGLNLAKASATLNVIGIAPSALTLLTPPAVLYWLSAANNELGKTVEWDLRTLAALFGLFAWALLSLFIWTATRVRFRKLTSRWPYRRPEFRGLPPQVSGWGRLHELDAWQDSGAAVP